MRFFVIVEGIGEEHANGFCASVQFGGHLATLHPLGIPFQDEETLCLGQDDSSWHGEDTKSVSVLLLSGFGVKSGGRIYLTMVLKLREWYLKCRISIVILQIEL